MEAENIDYENATEEQLAELRGDNFEGSAETPPETTGESESVPEPETSKEVADPEPKADDGSAETEAAAEAEETPPEPEKPATQDFMIPKSRYDAVMARLKEAEKREQAQPQQAPAPQPEVDPITARLNEIDAEIATAVKDGDGDKAAQLMAESRNIQTRMFSEQLQQTSQQTSSAAIQQVQYDTLVEQVEYYLPETNPDSEAYDEGLVLEVQELMGAFEAKGYTSANALNAALGYVRPGWNSEQQQEEQPAAQQEPPPPEPKKTDVKRNIEDAKAQPPKMEEGDNSDSAGLRGQIDVMKLSDSEFEKLTEKQLAELRGDYN